MPSRFAVRYEGTKVNNYCADVVHKVHRSRKGKIIGVDAKNRTWVLWEGNPQPQFYLNPYDLMEVVSVG